MGADGILLTEAGGVVTLTLARPHKHNALTLEMRQYIEHLPEELATWPRAACLVLDAVGPSFCAGADIAEIGAAAGPMPATNPARGIRHLTIPSVAAVHATCVTGGLELALAADIIVAGRSARFADTHTRMNVLPRWGMSAALPRRVGAGRALEMSLTNRWVQAEEAHEIGLVDVLVDDDQLGGRVHEIAAAAARCAPEVVATTRSLMKQAGGGDLGRALAAEEAAWRAAGDSPPPI